MRWDRLAACECDQIDSSLRSSQTYLLFLKLQIPIFSKGCIVTRAIRFFQMLLALTSVGLLGSEVGAQEPSLTEVLASTPNRANAILYADVSSLRSLTPGSMLHADLPEALSEVRIAADLNLKSFETSWDIGYVTLTGWRNTETLAKSMKGYIDSIAGKSVIWTPRQSYLVPMANNVIGIVRPSDRKLVARWLNKEIGTGSSAYLKKHAVQGSKFISLLLAVDLQDTWSPIALERKIESFESLKGMDMKSVATTLSSVHGIRIIVGRRNLNECIISLDFGSSPANLLPVAKNFFVEVLQRNQSSMPEASNWVASMDGNTIAFRGSITVDTLDHLLGIFRVQGQAADITSSGLEPIQDPRSESALLETNKTFYAKSTNIIKRVRDYSASNTGSRAQMNGQMARRLDDLPTLNVDPELVNFTVAVSKGLRGNMVAMQQTNIKAGAEAIANNAGAPQIGFQGGWQGGNFGFQDDSNSLSRYADMAQAQGNYSYRELIAKIDEMEADIRRRMTEKYKVQF